MTDDLTRAVALELLRRGEITMSEAAELSGVTRQAVKQWCERAGVDPLKARRSLIERRTVQVTRVAQGREFKPVTKTDLRHRAAAAHRRWAKENQ